MRLRQMLAPAPFDSDVEECRKKNGGGLETQRGGEEEDTEGGDHYEDAFSLAHGTLTLLLMQCT